MDEEDIFSRYRDVAWASDIISRRNDVRHVEWVGGLQPGHVRRRYRQDDDRSRLIIVKLSTNRLCTPDPSLHLRSLKLLPRPDSPLYSNL